MKNLELIRKKSVMLSVGVEDLCINIDNVNCEENTQFQMETDGIVQRWLARREFNPYQCIVLLGLGTGKCVKEILANMQEESMLLIYEPYKEKLYDLANGEAYVDILEDDRAHIIVEGVNEEEFSTFYVCLVTDIYENRVCFWQNPSYLDVDDSVIKKYHEHIENCRELQKIQKRTREIFHKDYHKNIIHGAWKMPEVKNVEELKKVLPQDKLIVLVAAGPSLENALGILKEKREKIIIVAVYRVVDYLLEHEIIPDLITTMDSHQIQSKVDEDIISKIPMILPDTASIEVWEHHKGVKFLGALETYGSCLLGISGVDMVYFQLQSSVAAWQLSIMSGLGIDKVALVGQDLAYSGEVSHVGGVKETANYSGEVVEGISGEMLPSRGDWLVHKSHIENIIKCYPNMKVYDTKTCGAKIKYTINESLENLIDKYGNDNINNINKKIQELPFLLENDNLKKYKSELEKSEQIIEEMLQKSKRLILLAGNICEKKNIDFRKKSKAIKEISEINMWMDEQKEMEIITNFVEAQTMDLAGKLLSYKGDPETEEYNTYLYMQEYYRYIVMGLEEVKKTINEIA